VKILAWLFWAQTRLQIGLCCEEVQMSLCSKFY